MSHQVAIDERIHQLVEAHRPELEQLIDRALERELAQLVEQRIAVRNGATVPYPQVGNEPAAATKVCVGPCGRELPLSAFEAGRAKCRECRRADRRQATTATAAPAEEPPRPDASDET